MTTGLTWALVDTIDLNLDEAKSFFINIGIHFIL